MNSWNDDVSLILQGYFTASFDCLSDHYDDVIMGAMASQIISLTIVYSTVYSDAHQGKHQSSASLAFVWGIHRGPVNSPHKWPVTRKMSPFDDVIICARKVTLNDMADWQVANQNKTQKNLHRMNNYWHIFYTHYIHAFATKWNGVTTRYMMTSSNGNIFRVTGPLCGGIHRARWIPHTKASDAELWCFLWSAPE